jgi:hypothetical protein
MRNFSFHIWDMTSYLTSIASTLLLLHGPDTVTKNTGTLLQSSKDVVLLEGPPPGHTPPAAAAAPLTIQSADTSPPANNFFMLFNLGFCGSRGPYTTSAHLHMQQLQPHSSSTITNHTRGQSSIANTSTFAIYE